jgi:hypothetical protein
LDWIEGRINCPGWDWVLIELLFICQFILLGVVMILGQGLVIMIIMQDHATNINQGLVDE